MKWVHILSNKDIENKQADCKNCGRVEIYLKGKVWKCLPGKREHTNDSRNRKKYGVNLHTRTSYCEVCSKDCVTRYDHDHTTGRFRGWLCNGCNLALGNAYDNPEILRKLADYLERNNEY